PAGEASSRGPRMMQALSRCARSRLTWAVPAGAMLGGLAFLLYMGQRKALPETTITERPVAAARSAGRFPQDAQTGGMDFLKPQSRPPARAVNSLDVGETVQTPVRKRRRFALPDGSVLYVNQNTKARLDRERELTLCAGEVFLEVTPPADRKRGQAFV